MKNEYLQEILKFPKVNSCRQNEKSYVVSWDKRDELVFKYAWAIPDDHAIETISKYGPIIEIGAGKGYWANLISQKTSVVAFDISIKNNKYADGDDRFFHVEKTSNKLISDLFKIHNNKTLFLCWPPYANSMAYSTLKKYKGYFFIYIGEGYGGCTGDDKFHLEIEKKWELVEQQDIPQFEGLYDNLMIYKRKSLTKKRKKIE